MRDANLAAAVILLALAIFVFLLAPAGRRQQLFAVFLGGYALWTIVYFLSGDLRGSLAWAGAVAVLVSGFAGVAMAMEQANSTRRELTLALIIGTSGWALTLATVIARYAGSSIPVQDTMLWGGYALFPAACATALVLFAFAYVRTGGTEIALTAAGLVALAGLVGGRMWLVGPQIIRFGIAVSYSLGIAASSTVWLAHARRSTGARNLALFSLGTMLGGMLVTVALGNVNDIRAALVNAAWRTAGFATIAYAIVRAQSLPR